MITPGAGARPGRARRARAQLPCCVAVGARRQRFGARALELSTRRAARVRLFESERDAARRAGARSTPREVLLAPAPSALVDAAAARCCRARRSRAAPSDAARRAPRAERACDDVLDKRVPEQRCFAAAAAARRRARCATRRTAQPGTALDVQRIAPYDPSDQLAARRRGRAQPRAGQHARRRAQGLAAARARRDARPRWARACCAAACSRRSPTSRASGAGTTRVEALRRRRRAARRAAARSSRASAISSGCRRARRSASRRRAISARSATACASRPSCARALQAAAAGGTDDALDALVPERRVRRRCAQQLGAALLATSCRRAPRTAGIFRDEHDARIDELRAAQRPQQGRDRCGSSSASASRPGSRSLKIRFTRVFGYYIEITKSKLGAVPDDYGASRPSRAASATRPTSSTSCRPRS